jgi:protein required for attachment to host cells
MRRHYHKMTERVLLKEYHKDLSGKPVTDIVAAMREKV